MAYTDFPAFNCVIEFSAQALSCFDGRLGRVSCRLRFRVAENAPKNRVSDSKGRLRSNISPAEGAAKRCASRGAKAQPSSPAATALSPIAQMRDARAFGSW